MPQVVHWETMCPLHRNSLCAGTHSAYPAAPIGCNLLPVACALMAPSPPRQLLGMYVVSRNNAVARTCCLQYKAAGPWTVEMLHAVCLGTQPHASCW